MPCGFIDFEIQENVFSTEEMKKIFDEKERVRRWLNIEAALAEAQAIHGVIPKEAAREITEKAQLEKIDLDAVKAAYLTNRNSLLPVIQALKEACSKKSGEYVHYGATTQDIIDTGQVLEIKESLQVFYRDLRVIEQLLLELVKAYDLTPMIGRTHSQHALPITFGLKVSVWLGEIRRHIERVKALRNRALTGQLFGAVGTMAAFGERAFKISETALTFLGLRTTHTPWHTARDNMAEIGTLFSMIAQTVSKIANEIFQLGKSEIMEIREGAPSKKNMSSSAMPHKRNPVLCERISVLGKHIRALSGVVVESMIHENERDPRALWAEWLSMPQLMIYTGAALNYLIQVIEGLEVYPERMKENLYLYKSFVVSEYLLFKLGEKMGKMTAQETLHEIVQFANHHNCSLKDALKEHPRVFSFLSNEDLIQLDHPETYLGKSGELTRALVAYIEEERRKDPNHLFVKSVQ